jgi:hypothetical protein
MPDPPPVTTAVFTSLTSKPRLRAWVSQTQRISLTFMRILLSRTIGVQDSRETTCSLRREAQQLNLPGIVSQVSWSISFLRLSCILETRM